MGQVYAKYADPSSFLNQVIYLNRFSETVDELVGIENDQKLWELYLACVANSFREVGSFEEFKESTKAAKPIDIEATVQTSFNILSDFHPREGVNPSGTF